MASKELKSVEMNLYFLPTVDVRISTTELIPHMIEKSFRGLYDINSLVASNIRDDDVFDDQKVLIWKCYLFFTKEDFDKYGEDKIARMAEDSAYEAFRHYILDAEAEAVEFQSYFAKKLNTV